MDTDKVSPSAGLGSHSILTVSQEPRFSTLAKTRFQAGKAVTTKESVEQDELSCTASYDCICEVLV